MPDYENDLAFKPAMTWNELCEYAKSKYKAEKGFFESWFDIECGECVISFYNRGDVCVYGSLLAENRTYEQMKNIIDNLYGED